MFKRIAIPVIVTILAIWVCVPLAADVDSPTSLSSVGSQSQETRLGDLVADAVRESAGTPIALVPAGALKDITIPKGTVTTEEVLKCLQYPDDQVAVIEVAGGRILSALERSVSIYPQKNLGFLQVSGLTFTFDPGAPKGSRVSSVKVGKEDLKADSKYKVATTKPLADGAYGYFTIWGKGVSKQVQDSTISDAVKAYLSSRDSVDYRNTDRMNLKSNQEE